jgi:hypothetical protein
MAKRPPTPLKLSPALHGKLLRVAESHGLTPQVAVIRVIEWLAKQPELIQAAVLGKFPATIDPELAKHILRSITRES